jgi:hypothetical protein
MAKHSCGFHANTLAIRLREMTRDGEDLLKTLGAAA